MLAEDLRPPKRARNPPHHWVEQKGEKKEKNKEREGKEKKEEEEE